MSSTIRVGLRWENSRHSSPVPWHANCKSTDSTFSRPDGPLMDDSEPQIHPEWLARASAVKANYRFAVTCADGSWYDTRHGHRIRRDRLPLVRARFDTIVGRFLTGARHARLFKVPPKPWSDSPDSGPVRVADPLTIPPGYVSSKRG